MKILIIKLKVVWTVLGIAKNGQLGLQYRVFEVFYLLKQQFLLNISDPVPSLQFLVSFLSNSNFRVSAEVKNTIKQLNFLEDTIVKTRGHITNSELNVSAMAPCFTPNRSLLVNLLVIFTCN